MKYYIYSDSVEGKRILFNETPIYKQITLFFFLINRRFKLILFIEKSLYN